MSKTLPMNGYDKGCTRGANMPLSKDFYGPQWSTTCPICKRNFAFPRGQDFCGYAICPECEPIAEMIVKQEELDPKISELIDKHFFDLF
jgi:hypothetical protein